MAWQDAVSIAPIGVVESALTDFAQTASYDSESTLVIRPDLADELIGIEHFSHFHVLYFQHRRQGWDKAMGLSQADEQALAAGCLRKGLYTSRSPARPSGIGSCVVELLRHDGNRLLVKGLDAFNGTPLLDIKIYVPRYDSVPMADAPLHWCTRHDIATTSRLLHWDTMNVGLTLGLRAGQRALKALDLARGEADHAIVTGGPFFAQGVEGVTGCSVLHHNLDFNDSARAIAEWSLVLRKGVRQVEIRLANRRYAGADDVLCLADEQLFRLLA